MGGGIEKRAAASGGLEKDLKTTSLKAVSSKAVALTSTALTLVLSAVATPALANTVNGAPAPAYTIKLGATVGTYNVTVDTDDVGGPGSVGITPVITPTSRVDSAAIEITNAGFNTVTVNSGRLVGAHNTYAGIWINRGESLEAPYTGVVPATATIVNNGMIQGSQFGIDISGLCGANCTSREMSTINISGTGTVFGATGMSLRGETINVNGQSLIVGWNTGLEATGTTINLGQTNRLGSVQAGSGNGIVVRGANVSLRLSSVTAGGATGAGVWVAAPASGFANNLVQFNGQIMSLGTGILIDQVPGRPRISGESLGVIRAGSHGIHIRGDGGFLGNAIVESIPRIEAGGTGIWVEPGIGRLNVSFARLIVAGLDGIRAYGPSGLSLNDGFGRRGVSIEAIRYGVLLDPFVGPLPLNGHFGSVDLNIESLNAAMGIYATNMIGSFTINLSGAVTTAQTGIYLYNVSADTYVSGTGLAGSSRIISGLDGINIHGRVVASNTTGKLSSVADINAVWATNGDAIRLSNQGSIRVRSIGSIKAGRNGIVAWGLGGITLSTIGSIEAGERGIDVLPGTDGVVLWLVQNSDGLSSVSVASQLDGVRIQSAAWFTATLQATISSANGTGVLANALGTGRFSMPEGLVEGGVAGVSLSGQEIIASTGVDARIRGGTGMMLLARGTAISTLANFGTISTTQAAGAAGAIGLATNGQLVVSNFGTVTGRLTHNAQSGNSVMSLAFYNLATGIWNAGSGASSFGGAADYLGNVGTINLSAGATEFSGLEVFQNAGGGVISFLGSTAATDELVVGGWLQLQDGGRLRVNFNADAALGTLDRGTSGNADSITSTLLSATGVTTIDIVATGGSNGAGAPVPLTGSVVLVSTGLALPAPAPGATLTPAANYVFGTGNPSTAARTFTLVGDGLGGVFLQWVPVTSGGTIGGFSGGALGAADSASGSGVGGGLGFLQASLAGASQAAVQVADMTSFGAAFGGTGAAGAGCGSAGGAAFSVRTGEWAGTGRRSASGSSAQGRDLAFSPGAGSDSCGRVSVGAFQFGGTATVGLQAQRGTDAARGTTQGAGGYVRADSGTGFFAQLTGAAGSQRARVRNGIFGTEATVDTTLGLVDITAGYATPISDGLAIETRLSATRLTSAANPFRDSLGYEVTRLETRADSLTATAGLIARTGSGGQGFVRAGLRTTDARQDGLAYGIRTLSQDSGTGSVLEAGWNQPLGDEASVEFALSSDSGGPLERQEARVQLSLGW